MTKKAIEKKDKTALRESDALLTDLRILIERVRTQAAQAVSSELVLLKPELTHLRETDKLTPDLIFRDPNVLNFLGLKDIYGESDIKTAILCEIERFLLDAGTNFTVVARQKRIIIDGEDFYLDLLLYHRRLQCLVDVELKIGKFEAEHKGKMELYLRWLNKHERLPNENAPLGLLLCTEARTEHIELLELTASGIHVAEYLTELPPRELLQARLQKATRLAQAQF